MNAIETFLIRVVVYGILLAGVIGGSIALWEHFMHPDAPVVEKAAPAAIQSDGSLELARSITTPTTKPVNVLPKGAKLQRQESVTIQPRDQVVALKTSTGLTQTQTITPKAVTVNLDLVKLADGTDRVTASSPDGTVTGGLDIPAAPLPPDPPKNAAGLSYAVPIAQIHGEGIWYERDLPLHIRAGIEFDHIESMHGSANAVMIRAGGTW